MRKCLQYAVTSTKHVNLIDVVTVTQIAGQTATILLQRVAMLFHNM